MSKASRTNRNPSREVTDKLPLELSKQLALDFEEHSEDTWKQFVARKLRKEYQSGPYAGAAENRFTYLKKLKVHTPAKYFKVFAKAVNSSLSEEDSPDEFCGSESGSNSEESDSEEEEERSATSLAKKIKSRPPAKKTAAQREPPKKTQRASRPSLNSKTIQSPPSQLKMTRRSQPARAPPSVNSNTSRLGYRPSVYASLDDAELDADQIIRVDFDKPEKNGSPLFYLQEVTNVKSEDGKVLISKLMVVLNSLTDLRDYELTKGTVVCDGAAFLVCLPSLPFFRRNEKSIKAQFEKEAARCLRTEEEYLGTVLPIAANPERLLTKYLFVMPEGCIVSGDMGSEVYPASDYLSHLFIRPHNAQFTTGAVNNQKNREQTWYTGYWMLRIVSAGTAPLEEATDQREPDLEDGFAGMRVI
jgi:hypothetical protein